MEHVDRPSMPSGYGLRADSEGQVHWAWVEERLTGSRNYWVCTTRADGRPHAIPVWAVWVDGVLLFSTDPKSLKGRNLAARPEVVVHLESGDEVVILEGVAEQMDPARLQAFADVYDAKYGYRIDTDNADFGLYQLDPGRVLAWREADFPTSATRFRRTLSP